MDNLREEIKGILNKNELGKCKASDCPDNKDNCSGCQADQIINLLADHGYGKMVDGEERVSFTSGEFGGRCVYREKIFQPIERIK